MTRYEVEFDLGGEGAEAAVTVRGSEAEVLELLGRMHVWFRNERARKTAEPKVEPCRGCGE